MSVNNQRLEKLKMINEIRELELKQKKLMIDIFWQPIAIASSLIIAIATLVKVFF